MIESKLKHVSIDILSAIMYMLAICVCVLIVPTVNRNTMMFYLSIISISIMFALISERTNEKNFSRIYLWLSMAFLGSLMAFRAQTAIDDWVYKEKFLRANEGLITYVLGSSTEKGYDLLNWVLYRITRGNYNIAQAIIAYISVAIWGKAILSIEKFCSIPIVVLLIWTHYYFVVLGAGLIRIFIALPIVLYALHFYWEGNIRSFIIWIIIASLFHMSALIILALSIFSFNKRWFFDNWVFVVLFLLYMIPTVFIIAAKVVVPLLGVRYAKYGTIGSFSLSIGSFDTLPILIIGLYYLKVIPEKNRKAFIVGLVLISLSMIFSLFSSMVDLGRLIYYGNLGIIVVVAQIFKLKSTEYTDAAIKAVLIAYSILFMMHTVIMNDFFAENLFPYRPFF